MSALVGWHTLEIGRDARPVVIYGRSKERSDARRPEDPCHDFDAPQDLNYASLPGLLETSGDPWAEIDEAARDLPVMEERR